MIFLTVGTQFPFDRLVRAVDQIIGEGAISETVFGQIGHSAYKPVNFEAVVRMEKDAFDKCFREASGIIGHAGMGTISMALSGHKPLLAMPRLRKYGEVVNNHQLGIAKMFSERGYILAAYGVEDLPDGVRRLADFVPAERRTAPNAVANRISRFLSTLQGGLGED